MGPTDFDTPHPVVPLKRNKLDEILTESNISDDQISDCLGVNPKTIYRHRKGQSPISVEQAEQYADILNKHYSLPVEPMTLITSKASPDAKMFTDSVTKGKIPVIGQFHQKEGRVEFFEQGGTQIYLHSEMHMHYTNANNKYRHVNALVFIDGLTVKPFQNFQDFQFQDYHYWLFPNSPIHNKVVHKDAPMNLSIVKTIDDKLYCGILYANPKKNLQSPNKYSIEDPEWGLKNQFTPKNKKLTGLQLKWATPVISVIMNPNANMIKLYEE